MVCTMYLLQRQRPSVSGAKRLRLQTTEYGVVLARCGAYDPRCVHPMSTAQHLYIPLSTLVPLGPAFFLLLFFLCERRIKVR